MLGVRFSLYLVLGYALTTSSGRPQTDNYKYKIFFHVILYPETKIYPQGFIFHLFSLWRSDKARQ